MRLFSSARERRLWLWALAVVAAIYSTLGLAGTMARTLRELGLLDVSTWVLVAMFLVGMTIVTQGLRVRPGGVEIAVMLGVAAVYLLLVLRSTASPAERTHLMEYGVLGVFIHEALAERVRRGRHVPLPPVIAVLVTAALGAVDEGIQWFLPNRVFDPVDMLFNFLAGTTSVAAVVALAWARRWTLRRRRQPGITGGRKRGGGRQS